MSENQYSFKYDEFGNTREILVYGSGVGVNSSSFINKGTAFNKVERERLGLQACLPPGVRPIEDQVDNSRKTFDAKVDDIEKYIFIRALFDRNVTLAHALIKSDFRGFLDIIYTPTITEVVKRYSSMFRQANGLHFYPGNIDAAEDILRRYQHRDIRVAVVTDNQGVHGLGDQGIGGITVCLGKLMLYTQVAGVAPWHCLPISLDVGTDNEQLLEDDRYLGWRNERLKGEEYLAFIGRFARAFRNVFPNALCQWEDFSRQNAFTIRDAFSEELISFNDDIQGSGSCALAALLSAMKLKQKKLQDQTILINGSDTVGVGIAQQLEQWFIENGLDETEALERIVLTDSQGVLRQGQVVDHYKQRYGKDENELQWQNAGTDLIDVIEKLEVTVLIDTCSTDAVLTEKNIKKLKENCTRPVVLSFGAGVDEKLPELLWDWSGESVLFSSSQANHECFDEQTIRQCHNSLIFPGIGLGILASGARRVLPEFFVKAAEIVSKQVKKCDLENGALLPSLDDVDEIALKVAHGVAMMAVEKGLARPCVYSNFQHMDDEVRMKELIVKMRWKPDYLPLVAM